MLQAGKGGGLERKGRKIEMMESREGDQLFRESVWLATIDLMKDNELKKTMADLPSNCGLRGFGIFSYWFGRLIPLSWQSW